MKKIVLILFILLICENALAETYFYAGSKAIAVKDSQGEVTYLYQDRLGSDTQTKSLPFGQVIRSGERFGFTGKERDDSGLHYFAARYYDSSIGRFTSVDPVRENHPYTYVHNNAMNRIDPTGMNDGWAYPQHGSQDLFHGSAGTGISGFAKMQTGGMLNLANNAAATAINGVYRVLTIPERAVGGEERLNSIDMASMAAGPLAFGTTKIGTTAIRTPAKVKAAIKILQEIEISTLTKIGEGSFGTVYDLSKEFVVKIAKKTGRYGDIEVNNRALRDEVEALQRLHARSTINENQFLVELRYLAGTTSEGQVMSIQARIPSNKPFLNVNTLSDIKMEGARVGVGDIGPGNVLQSTHHNHLRGSRNAAVVVDANTFEFIDDVVVPGNRLEIINSGPVIPGLAP